MNNQNFEFKSYTPTPDDQYMLGVAKVKLYGRLVVHFKHVKTKDGQGTFFCAPTVQTKDAMGEKKYLPAFLLDSRDDEDALDEAIRKGVNAVLAQRNGQQSQSMQYPHGLCQPVQVPTSMDQMPIQADCPF
jgi:hypothetical protein